jgi:hypothetical protein
LDEFPLSAKLLNVEDRKMRSAISIVMLVLKGLVLGLLMDLKAHQGTVEKPTIISLIWLWPIIQIPK